MTNEILEEIAYDPSKKVFVKKSNGQEVYTIRLGEINKHRFTVPEERLQSFLRQTIEFHGFQNANAFNCRNWRAFLCNQGFDVSTYTFYKIS